MHYRRSDSAAIFHTVQRRRGRGGSKEKAVGSKLKTTLVSKETRRSSASLRQAALGSGEFVDVGAWWRFHEMMGEALVNSTNFRLFSEA